MLSSRAIAGGGAIAAYAASRTLGSGSRVSGADREIANARSRLSPAAEATAALSRQSGLDAHCRSSEGRRPARATEASSDERYTIEVSAAHSAGKSVASFERTVPKLCAAAIL